MYSSPMLYFDWLKDSMACDLSLPLESFREKYLNLPKGVIILGGGGILSPTMMPRKIECVMNMGMPIIIWGAGANEHGRSTLRYLDLSSCLLLGIRDYGPNYVPCVSCMSCLFDDPPEPTHEHVIYEHKDFPIEGVAPRMSNETSSLKDAVSFLASGATVETSSYHGAYWAMLLGRKVIIHPFSSKFNGFKRQSDGFLEECRDLNVEFAKKVRAYSVPI